MRAQWYASVSCTRSAVAEFPEALSRRFRQRSGYPIAVVDASQRSDAIPALLLAQLDQVRKLHIAPRADFFADDLLIAAVIELVEDLCAARRARAQAAVIQLQFPAAAGEAEEVAVDRGKAAVLGMVDMDLLVQRDRVLAPGQDIFDIGQQHFALGDGQRLVHAAWHRRGAVDALPGDRRDDLLSVLAQLHAFQCEIGILVQHADDVALFRIAAETE